MTATKATALAARCAEYTMRLSRTASEVTPSGVAPSYFTAPTVAPRLGGGQRSGHQLRIAADRGVGLGQWSIAPVNSGSRRVEAKE
jgi:hypothetical protein